MDRVRYARLLRAIGQDLEALAPEKLDIEVDQSVFLATLEVITRVSEPPPSEGQQKGGFLRALLKPATLPAPPSVRIETIQRRYMIAELERVAAADQGASDSDETPDFYNLGEFLGVIGTYLDKNQARLLKLSKHDLKVTLHYQNPRGQSVTEEEPLSSFYDLYLHMFKRRHSPTATLA